MTREPENSWVGGSQNNRHLLRTAQIGIAALLAYCVYKGWNLPVEELSLALLVVGLAAWPILRWLKKQPYPFPAFETFMLTGITAYAMPLITDHVGVARYPAATILASLTGVVIFQMCALLTFTRTRILPLQTHFWTDPLFDRKIDTLLHTGLWASVVYVYVHFFTTWLPYDIDSILRAIFFGISTACTFLLGRSWGRDELSPRARFSLVAALLISAVIQTSSLYLINTISAVMVFFLAYISAGRRIPFIPLIGFFIVLTVLHNGKAPMREKYWAEGMPATTVTQLPDFFVEWAENGMAPFSGEDKTLEKRDLFERASLLHMMCLVVNETEKGLPLLGGETYGNVLPMLVPRFFWPDKPSGQLTVRRLSIHYGLQDEDASRTTSIGFGMLSESYANFGFLGLALLGLVIGFTAKVITMWTSESPLLSNGGMIMILLMAWSLQIELPMSGWISSFYQAAICMLGIPYALKKIFN